MPSMFAFTLKCMEALPARHSVDVSLAFARGFIVGSADDDICHYRYFIDDYSLRFLRCRIARATTAALSGASILFLATRDSQPSASAS